MFLFDTPIAEKNGPIAIARRLLAVRDHDDRAIFFTVDFFQQRKNCFAGFRIEVAGRFNPPILLADEPTGNLDSKTGEAILSLLKEINREEDCTVVMVTHSQEAARYGDRTIFLRDGRVEKEHC